MVSSRPLFIFYCVKKRLQKGSFTDGNTGTIPGAMKGLFEAFQNVEKNSQTTTALKERIFMGPLNSKSSDRTAPVFLVDEVQSL
jgi:hypothetical protein